ncbi:MAG: iron-sulfur cluster assembly accessory protein [Deltaproteobacteria bacterium]|nr:iron-sulfur cluster assembly accessory protein [Deltaproteobacteria bacterium]
MIQVTEKAINEIKRILSNDPTVQGAHLRVMVAGGGCSGMSYKLGFEKELPAPTDKVFEKDGIKILVDAKSFLYLSGNVFGIERKFKIDFNYVESKYYELCKVLHPDRFIQSGEAALKVAHERMSFLNLAFQVLKDEDKRRNYLLKLHGICPDLNQKDSLQEVPLELTEAWFELQDLLSENPTQVHEKTIAFLKSLKQTQDETQIKITECEENYDQSLDRALLEEIAKLLKKQNYLNSLEKDFYKKIKAS